MAIGIIYSELKNFPFAGEAVREKKEDSQHLFQRGNFQQSHLLKEYYPWVVLVYILVACSVQGQYNVIIKNSAFVVKQTLHSNADPSDPGSITIQYGQSNTVQ